MTDDEMKRLQAAELHEHVSPAIAIEEIGGHSFQSGKWTLIIKRGQGAQMPPSGVMIGMNDLYNFSIHVADLLTVIALLQRAQQIVEGGT